MAPLQPSATPHSRSLRRGQEGGKKAHPPERSASFHGRSSMVVAPAEQRQMQRPKTQPDLLAGGRKGGGRGMSPEVVKLSNGGEQRRVPAKVLVNVTVQRSLGAVQVMASTEWMVEDLVAAAVRLYVKEGRRPPLPTKEPSAFGLHYSQFSLECLDPKEKLIGLGSRNFFLCPKNTTTSASASGTVEPTSSAHPPPASCSNEAEESKIPIPRLRIMDFLL